MSPARKSSELALFSYVNVVPHFFPMFSGDQIGRISQSWSSTLDGDQIGRISQSWSSTLDGVRGIIIVPESCTAV